MSKSDHLKQAKSFLRKVVNYRKTLADQNKSYIPSSFTKTETSNIGYAINKIVSCDQMQRYLERKEAAIRLLIPTNKHKWYNELNELITFQIN